MPRFVAPSLHVEGMSIIDVEEINTNIADMVKFIEAREDGVLRNVYVPPTLEISGIPDYANMELNSRFQENLLERIEGPDAEALGAIATAVIASVAGSVAATVVSKIIDNAATADDLGNLDVRITNPGRFVE